MTELMQKTAESLIARGFRAICAHTAQEAVDQVMALISPEDSVGIGGSMTVKELGLSERLRTGGHPVYWHWDTPGDRNIFLQAAQADAYLASCNAVTVTGIPVNIDGTGNRVAAMQYGPKQVILIVGRNKLVDGGVQAAIARIKREACPLNARRLHRDTPCAATGSCDASVCRQNMCRVFSIMELPPAGHPVTVILVDEPLGY